jgi:LuxR family maltose regulon positive regulatory protein
LIDRLIASPGARTVTIVAPPGYGKTTLMSLWRERESKPIGWLTVDRYDNDPATLLCHIVAALQHVGMLSGISTDDVQVRSDRVISHGVGRLVNALDEERAVGALMLDHVETLSSRTSCDVVAELAARLPASVQLVVASRTSVRLPLAHLRADGALLELTASDLAMDESEARGLLANIGVDVGDELDELIAHAEGWPVGLFLIAGALKAGSRRQPVLRIGGDDRFLADYLREEVLDRVSLEDLSFLMRTSVLERFCGPLCDAVLGVTGSARTIERLEVSNLLIVPLDRTRSWYRYHHLLQEFLQAELSRREPDIVAGLHANAARWFDANNIPEEAISHAQAADDGDLVARIVGREARRTYAHGRADTAFGWLRWFERTGRIGHYPEITALGAWACAMAGDALGADQWAHALFANGRDLGPSGMAFRAVLGRRGISGMRADALATQQMAAPASEWQAAAVVLEGMADLWAGDVERADMLFTRAASMGERLIALPAAALALAEQAVIAIGLGEWDAATRYADQSVERILERGLERYATSGLTFAVAARCAIHRADIDRARGLLAHATTIRPMLSAATPGISVQTLLEMARAHLALSDVTGARTVARQGAFILAERPDLGALRQQHGEIKAQLDTMTGGVAGASALTTAELRLLPFLLTHLSFPEIGERLSISRHTVKTQAMSIYRKLDASSRSEAVQHATDAGLLSS